MQEAARRVREARDALQEHRNRIEKARKETDFLRHAAEELGKLAPQAGEEEKLAERRTVMMQSEKVAQDLTEAFEAVAGASSPVPVLSAAMRKLERRAAQAPALVDPSVKALDAALLRSTRLAPLCTTPCARRSSIRGNWSRPRSVSSRCALRPENTTCRPTGLRICASDSWTISRPSTRARRSLDALEKAAAEADKAYVRRQESFRPAGARRPRPSTAQCRANFPPLKLERARFITEIQTDETNRDAGGFDRVEFWAQTNPGTRPGPLMKVASGGELSRFMLALKVVLADKGSAPTLVFDEIDTGVGGAVADAIGHRLARLAGRVQVMAVTHAPQVAARALSHFLIAKEGVRGSDRVATRVVPLEATPRREEIARMLAGATITEEARAAAARLLEAATN